MRIVDLNVLVYATDEASARHVSAKRWLDSAMQSTRTLGLPTAVTVGFIRLVTNPRILVSPIGVSHAASIVRAWLQRPNVTAPQPTLRHYTIVEELVLATGTGGNIVTDAHLAALAIEHGAELWSYDSDFGRFPGVVWHQPDEIAR